MLMMGSEPCVDADEELRPKEMEKTILDRAAEILWWTTSYFQRHYNEMESRRYRDPRDQDPDYGRRLRELEGQIQEIDREQHGFRMNGNYSEGGGKETSWKDWVLWLVGLGIVAWLGRISLQMENLQALSLEQAMMEKHLESTDAKVDQLESRPYRRNP